MSSSVEVLTDPELSELLRATGEDVAALEESGYTLIGGVRYTTSGIEAAAVLMVGPARDRVSTVARTPFGPVMAIGSGSETGRRVVSRNGSFWQLPAWELCNDVPVAEPPRLDEAHSAALAQLRDVFEPRIRDEMTIESMATELAEYLRELDSFRGTYGPASGFGPIRDDTRTQRRVKKWLSSAPRGQS